MKNLRPAYSGGVSTAILETVEHFQYNANKEMLVATRPIETTLNSFYLGGQHKISSGGENVFFENLGSDVNWYPMWGGIKDQSVAANKDSTGIIAPSSRVYSDALIEVEPDGAADTSGAVEYHTHTTLTGNFSVHTKEIIVEQDIAPTDYVFYSVHEGDHTDEMYTQTITGLTLSAGDTFVWNFNHPLENHSGQEIHGVIEVSTSGRDGPRTPLQARRSASAPTEPYFKLHLRTFTDEAIQHSGNSPWSRVGTTISPANAGDGVGVGTSDMSTSLGNSRLKVKSKEPSFNAFAVESSLNQDLLWVRQSTDGDSSIHLFDKTETQTVLFTTDTAVSYDNSGGNFGIGTDDPIRRLDVRYGLKTIDGVVATFGSTDGDPIALNIGKTGSATAAERGMWIDATESGVSDDRPLTLQRYGGDVGIGTDSPQVKLDVYKNDALVTPMFSLEQDGGGDASMRFILTGERAFTMGVDNSDNNFKIGIDANDVGVNPFFTIEDLTGNVGVGIVPTSKFHVEVPYNTSNDFNLGVKHSWSGGDRYVTHGILDGNLRYGMFGRGSSLVDHRIWTIDTWNGGGGSLDLDFHRWYCSGELGMILRNGMVKIGSNLSDMIGPTHTLEVVGDGMIHGYLKLDSTLIMPDSNPILWGDGSVSILANSDIADEYWKVQIGGTTRLLLDSGGAEIAGDAIISGNVQANGNGTDFSNFCAGGGAGDSLTIGGNNILIGRNSGYLLTNDQQNILIGSYAGYDTTAMSYSVGIGHNVLRDASGAIRTTAVGYGAGESAACRDGVYLGYLAGQYETQNNKLWISNDTNNLIEGDFFSQWVKVHGDLEVTDKIGIGIPEPSQKVHIWENSVNPVGMAIQNSGTGDPILQFKTSTSTYVMGIDNDNGDIFKIDVGSDIGVVPALSIDLNRNVGIGVDLPDEKLEVNGTIKAAQNVLCGTYFYLGDPDTDGSGRIFMSGGTMMFEHRSAGLWAAIGGFG
jgi:hypothetical protein